MRRATLLARLERMIVNRARRNNREEVRTLLASCRESWTWILQHEKAASYAEGAKTGGTIGDETWNRAYQDGWKTGNSAAIDEVMGRTGSPARTPIEVQTQKPAAS